MIRPYYEELGIQIYHADCREVLPQLPLGSVDLVLTDPPFGVGFRYPGQYHDTREQYIDWMWPTLMHAERCIKNGYMGVFQSASCARLWAQWFPREWELIALPKVFGRWYQNHRIQKQTDYVLYWTVGDAISRNTKGHKRVPRDFFVSYEVCVTANRPNHPCPRPLDTMLFLVELLSEPHSMILDPFMGSGTTLLAAKELGHHAIGIEIEECYCEVAVNRLRQGVLPFTAAD
jgi:site-specific DNA-methyltransferase (adenine-specific)